VIVGEGILKAITEGRILGELEGGKREMAA
jgi:hypothetical protein